MQPPSIKPSVFLNGRFIPFDEARLPIYDLGIVQGATITERLRTFGHRPCFVTEHLQRLEITLHQLDWMFETPLGDLPAIIDELVRHNAALIRPHEDLSIVLFVTAGEFSPDANGFEAADPQPTLCIYTAPLPLERFSHWYQLGVPLELTSVVQIPPESLDPRMKTRSRMHWYLADRQARQQNPVGQALLLDQQGFVTETSSGNLFVCRNGELWTPRAEATLGGISQQFVIGLAKQLGYRVERGDMTPAEILQQADEVFLTSSTYCIAPVGSLQGHRIGTGHAGNVTRRLQTAWSEHVAIDFVQQAISSASTDGSAVVSVQSE